jgi:5'-nucleotidase
MPLNTRTVAQFYTDLIRPLVDVVVFITHLGLEVDEDMIANTSGIDIVLGGHNHIALQPPKVIEDCKNVDEKGQHYVDILSSEIQQTGDDPKYVRRRCEPRKVILAHSGAFAKYVGRLDAALSNKKEDVGPTYDPINGFEVIAHEYQLLPVTEDTPEDSHVKALLEPYQQGLDALVDLELVVGYSPDGVPRAAPAGGDSALGNMVGTAMWLRQGVQTDFALTNTLGIRAEIVPGAVTIEQMYNVFPFDNSISKMQLSGVEVQKMFDFAARRSASRGCVSQIQIAGARIVMDCNGCNWDEQTRPCKSDVDCPGSGECNTAKGVCQLLSCTQNSDCPNSGNCDTTTKKCEPQACASGVFVGRSDKTCKADKDCANGNNVQLGICDTYNVDANGVGKCGTPIVPIASYELATSNYLAAGGSGFAVLKANTTQFDTKIQQRDALVDYIRSGKPCGYDEKYNNAEGLKACSADADCGDPDNVVCACTNGSKTEDDGTCSTTASGCSGNRGRCVLRGCRNDLAAFHRRTCESGRTAASQEACNEALNPCELGGETCKFVACIDKRVGNFTDNRQFMVGR